ncbi:hypothetical protein OSB04_020275, partial [Centaurea solstitialis]
MVFFMLQHVYFSTRASMTYINPHQTMSYPACNTCKKKVMESGEQGYWCNRCLHHKKSFTLSSITCSTADPAPTSFSTCTTSTATPPIDMNSTLAHHSSGESELESSDETEQVDDSTPEDLEEMKNENLSSEPFATVEKMDHEKKFPRKKFYPFQCLRWGLSHHFHYVPEILGTFFWTVPALFNH